MSFLKQITEGEITRYIDQIKSIYEHFLTFIDNSDPVAEGDFISLVEIIDKHDIVQNKETLNHFIGLLVSIANNHHRQQGFFTKIEQILIRYQGILQKTYNNEEIYELFESNKYLLLFLIKNKIITINNYIKAKIENKTDDNGDDEQFKDYFLCEIPNKETKDESLIYYIENMGEYEEKRQKGENDSYVCSLIRKDSIEDFVSFVTRNNFKISSQIKQSIFETNSFLIGKEPTVIEYAAFFGAVQIFDYLYMNGVNLTSSIWFYAIHSNNPDFIRNHVEGKIKTLNNKMNIKLLEECIKSHHNDIGRYIQDNLIKENLNHVEIPKNRIPLNERLLDIILKYSNYSFFPSEFNTKSSFFYFSKYKYLNIADFLYQSKRENIEKELLNYISNFFFLNKILKKIHI